MGLYDGVKLNNSQYVSQHVGSINDELLNTGKVLDDRYRKNKDYADKVAVMLAQEQVNPQDQSIKDRHIANVKDTLAKVASSPENFENSSGVVSNLARDVFTDPARIAALENKRLADKDRELQIAGYDLNFGSNRDTHQTVNPDTGEIQRFNLNREKRADYSGKMQHLLGKVADDGYSVSPTGEKIMFNDEERRLIRSGQVQHISPDKLHKLVDNLIPSYKASQEGDQDIRRLTGIEGASTEPITIPLYNKKGKVIGQRQTTPVDEDIRNRFYAIAAPQAYSNSVQHWEDFGVPADKSGIPNGGLGLSAGTSPGSFDDNSALDPIHSNTEGNPDYEKQSDGTYKQYFDKRTGKVIPVDKLPTPTNNTGIPGAGYQYSDERKNIGERIVKPEEAERDLRNQYDRITQSSANPQYKDYNDYKESNAAAIKKQEKIAPNGYKLGTEQAESYDKTINRDIADSPLYVSGKGEPTSLDKLAESMGIPASGIKLKAIKVFYDSPNKNLPGGYIEAKVELSDADAKNAKNAPTTVKLPINDQFVGLAQPIDHLMKNSFYQGKDTYTEHNPYFPQNEVINADPTKPQIGFYTTTYPIPKGQQKEGEPGFRTIVHSVVARRNSSGGYDLLPYSDDVNIKQWKDMMIGSMSKAFSNALNSGQTYNAKDVKERGLDW